MKLACETFASDILPTLRAIIARNLLDTHKLNQQEAAKRLFTSQSAISQYYRSLRGSKIKFLQKDKDILNEIERLSQNLAKGLSKEEFANELCNICKLIRKKQLIPNQGQSAEKCDFV